MVLDRWRYLIRLIRLLCALSPRAMVANGVVTLLIGLAPLLSLYALRNLVDAAAHAMGGPGGGAQGSAATAVLGWTAALVAAGFLERGIWILGGMVRSELQERLKTQVQKRVIAKAQALPLAAFEQAELYDQLQRIDRGLDQHFFSTLTSVFRFGNQAVTLAALLLFVATAHGVLPVILAGGTALAVFGRVRLRREKYLLERQQTERERRLTYFAGLMTGRDAGAEVRLFDLRDHLLQSWSRLHAELQDERLRLARREFRIESAGTNAQSLTLVLGLAVVVALVARGAVTVGGFAALLAAVQQFQQGLYWLFELVVDIDHDLRYIRDFFLYLDLPEEGTQAPKHPTPNTQHLTPNTQHLTPPLRQGIRFEGVRFAYPGSDRWVLDGIDLHLRHGERISLVGENGAGKTTLAKLLLGLYRPTEGRILVDGLDLAQLDPDTWRRRAAAIFQDFQQYHLTVRENIAFGDLERAEGVAAIERAARLSGADGVVATLPKGYDTPLGKAFDDGVELSVGQWQKIAVARAYLRDAEVLVLDEPTAALDARAEVEIYRQFRDASQGKTVLLISHRLGSARLADRILVLEGGRVAEEGTHADLMKSSGLYARMLGTQAQWYT